MHLRSNTSRRTGSRTLLFRFRHGTQALDMQRLFLELSSAALSFLLFRRALGGPSALVEVVSMAEMRRCLSGVLAGLI